MRGENGYVVPSHKHDRRAALAELGRSWGCPQQALRPPKPFIHPQEAPVTADKDAKADASKTDKRKQSLYFPESMLTEIKEEAARLDRSLSWVVQRAWKIARAEIKKLPSVNDVDGEDDDEG